MEGVYYDWKGNLIGIADETCGKCEYCEWDEFSKALVCGNADSSQCASFVQPNDCCDCFTEGSTEK